MIKLFIRYTNVMVITLFTLLIFSFLLPYMFPGDLLSNISGIVPQSPEQRMALERAYHLDQSILAQFIHYLESLFAGNWGASLSDQSNLREMVSTAFPATLELVCYAILVAIVVGLPLGFLSGLKHHNPLDFSVVTFSIAGYSLPVFWLALILISVFCLQLGWFPISGRIELLHDVPIDTGFLLIDIARSDIEDKSAVFTDAFRHLILPTLSATIVSTALTVRFARRSMMDVMEKDYIIAAKSRGFTQTQIFFKHGVKNALLPILPVLATQLSTLFTHVMIIETLFSWPGVGNWLIQAVYQQDYPAIRIGVLVVSVFIMFVTITVEFITRAVDPARERVSNAAI